MNKGVIIQVIPTLLTLWLPLKINILDILLK